LINHFFDEYGPIQISHSSAERLISHTNKKQNKKLVDLSYRSGKDLLCAQYLKFGHYPNKKYKLGDFCPLSYMPNLN
jgi:hypothetical protein